MMVESNLSIRPLKCANYLPRPDGSSLFSQGETIALVSFFGPLEAKQQNSKLDKSYVEIIYRPKTGKQTIKDKSKENTIKNICETAVLSALYPRTSVALTILEIENRGGFSACAINAVCMALLNSGIAMKYAIAGVHSIINEKDELVLDPNHREEQNAKASFTFVFDGIHRKVVACHTEGKFNLAQFNDAQTISKEASKEILDFYKNEIKNLHIFEE